MAKNNANIGFEKQIWDAACVLWGHIPAAEYRKVIVGLIFLRYISSAFEKRYNELVAEGDGFEDEPDAYLMENIFFAFAMFRDGKSDEEIFETERFSSMDQIRELRKKWRDSCVAA